MSSSRLFRTAAAAALLLLAGCVGIEEHERKLQEASELRKELEVGQARIASQARTIDRLRKKLEAHRVENEELAQSLTMARRHAQQIETTLPDLRNRIATESRLSRRLKEEVSELQKSIEKSRSKIASLQKRIVGLRGRLARFEDRARLQEQLYKDLTANFAREVKAGRLTIRLEGETVVLGLGSGFLFKFGTLKLTPQGKAALKKIGVALKRYANRRIQVQGHTDNIPISERLAEKWESNWELSSARAIRALRYLVEVENLDPRRASAAGFGEYRPIADNATKEGRRRNRRIDIVISLPPAN